MKAIILLLIITVGNNEGGVRVEIERLRLPTLRECNMTLKILEEANTWMDNRQFENTNPVKQAWGISSTAKGLCFETLIPR